MTIAVSLKVHDGVVLATDSASSLIAQIGGAPTVVQVYNNANKIFNLRKGLPIGAMAWGAGSIGSASISTLMKDLRARFSGDDERFKEWHIDPLSYSLDDVAKKVKDFLFDEHYSKEFANWPQKPAMGVLVAGYSSGKALADEFRIDIDTAGNCIGPALVRPNGECGGSWNGEPEAISRLLTGYSLQLPAALGPALGVDAAKVQAALQSLAPNLQAQLLHNAMPVQDVIDLAEFLVELTCNFSRYKPGAPTVGGPIEIAAITKHEGFKWVRRKHYFNFELNPDTTE